MPFCVWRVYAWRLLAHIAAPQGLDITSLGDLVDSPGDVAESATSGGGGASCRKASDARVILLLVWSLVPKARCLARFCIAWLLCASVLPCARDLLVVLVPDLTLLHWGVAPRANQQRSEAGLTL